MSGNIDAELDLLLILSNFASNLRENTAVFSRKVGMKSRNRGQPNDNSFFRFFFSELCWGMAMVAYTKP